MGEENFQPYQEGDFIKDEAGRPVKYRGPIFHVTYPAHLDSMQEMLGWMDAGFKLQTGFSYDSDKEFTIAVMGDIPQWMQDRLKERQIRVELSKPRGEVVDLK